MGQKPAPFLVYLVAALGIIIWGASPAATKLAVQELDGYSVAILRTFLAACLIAPIALSKRFTLPQTKTQWLTLAVCSVIGFIIYTFLYSIGLEQTSTIHAALIVAAAPIFTGLIGFSVEKKWPRKIWWAGAVVAFAGEIHLITSNSGMADGATLWGDFLVLLSILCVSAGYVAGGRLSAALGTWAATSWSVVIAGLILIPLFIPIASNTDWTSLTPTGWGALIYLVLFISILGYACWYWAIGQMGVGPIAPLQFGLPIVSMILGVLIFDEAITNEIVVACVAILAGIAITQRA
jgi:drug/metabolite transporter (DMT)-like permease